MNRFPKNFYSGLSGIQLPVPKYQYPPEYQNTSRLTYYASMFNSIEVNSSFYKIPMKNTVTRWATEVPDDFRFTFKLFREITHGKDLTFDPAHIETFLQTIARAENKKGALLIQFPPGLTGSNIHQLENLLQRISASDLDHAWNRAVEFRSKSWYNEDTYDLLQSYNTALVFQDIPKSATPSLIPWGNVVYVRFHGPTGNYDGSYSAAFLVEYAEYIKEWLAGGRTVYVYFNNTKGDAYNNLRMLNGFIADN